MKKYKGDLGEGIAQSFLKRKGVTVLTTNWRSHQVGEIDIVGQQGREIIFVEVKTRTSGSFGSGLESVDQRKFERLLATAEDFLAANPVFAECNWRVDVIEILLDRYTHRARINWYRGIS